MAQYFVEVINDYQEDETGRIAIDGYFANDDNGVVVAWVDKNGLVIPGDSEAFKPHFLNCSLVQEKILEAVKRQLKVEEKDKEIKSLVDSIHNLLASVKNIMGAPDNLVLAATAHSIAQKYPVTPAVKKHADYYAEILKSIKSAELISS